MKNVLLGAVLMSTALPAVAVAADMPYPTKAEVVVVEPVFSWTGFYIGANVGFGGNEFEYPFSVNAGGLPLANGSASIDSSGFFGGGQIGYNYQFANNVVLGVEADFEWSGIDGKVDAGLNIPLLPAAFSASAGSEVEWFGTIRARLGYAFDHLLVYGTGGAAYGKVKSSISVGGPGFLLNESADDTNWGWTAGAGFEYAINNNWTLKTEYLYVDLGSVSAFNGLLAPGVFGNLDTETTFHTAKVGLNYKF
ncbi:porin family protein [Ancylobacter dichloromethanicus]|uniref:Outer-membrane immunogenic protein n=1 Tax=Ancylobacter dichloromethanicus TaxID=518825 RepID=A0A9W6JAW5_9HYPH|nr:outer membrane protein [Ancylobacter dichloromethanicus]MBS7553141.1 porin family protein [Ancylobacter dichloromethanicus]GLK72918.1 outer-membrane immunogenic protein [Ancylobacter dichloromethanicus]